MLPIRLTVVCDLLANVSLSLDVGLCVGRNMSASFTVMSLGPNAVSGMH